MLVVVLPSEPVTPMILQGQTSKKASISEVNFVPAARSACSSGFSGCSPGVRKATSPEMPVR